MGIDNSLPPTKFLRKDSIEGTLPGEWGEKELTNDQINERIARLMGLDFKIVEIGSRVGIKLIGSHDYFSPATRWDHCGLAIEFMEKKGLRLGIDTTTSYDTGKFLDREVYFLVEGIKGKEYYPISISQDNLTPRHISLAIIAALEDDIPIKDAPKESGPPEGIAKLLMNKPALEEEK